MTTALTDPTTADHMSDGEAVASVLIPWPHEDNKAKYLRLRACGHAVRETLRHLDVGKSTLSLWRKDERFLELEEDLPNIRKILAKEWVELEWMRNFSLATIKDGEILERSRRTREVQNESTGRTESIPIPLSKQEHEWLMKRVGFYTPQQLAAMGALSKDQNSDGDGFNFQSTMLMFRDAGVQGRIVAREIAVELPSMQSAHEISG